MRKFLVILLLIFSVVMLFACTGGTDPDTPDTPPEDETVRVMVTLDDGVNVTSKNPLDVKKGEPAAFDVEIANGYAFISVSHGTYDPDTGKLTLDAVTERTSISFTLEHLNYDTDVEYTYIFNGGDKDTSSIEAAFDVKAGTQITVTAGDTKRIFVGWSFGKSVKYGADIVSTDRTYTFRISPDTVEDGRLQVFSNYTDSNIFYYDPMGGVVNVDTQNMAENDFYSARVDSAKVKITLFENYYYFSECACTFWDDGTFTREGYVLKEYNTKPDGSGEPYSLGSKFYPVLGDEHPTLYCIWEKAAETRELEYESYTMPKPDAAKFATNWCEEGVVITKYLSDAETVTVPETVDGKKVIAIAAGAFTNKRMTALVLPKTIQKIEDGAFTGCSELTTLYYPNSIYEISDGVFDAETYSGFTTLVVNATMAPRYTHTTDGGFAVKLSRFLAARDEKKIIVISGSSTYQGLGTEYMEALLDGEYTVINFGTTRPRPGLIYLEALSHYTDEDDIFIYAPENSSFMMGEQYLNWRILRDLEGMNNLFRYVDISNYYGYFSSFSELNRDYQYTMQERRFEDFVNNGYTSGGVRVLTDKNGDYQHPNRAAYDNEGGYVDAYFLTFNNRFKSMDEGVWNLVENQHANKDYTDPNNTTWTSIDRPEMVAQMNLIINKAKQSGAKVYFGFCPSDASAVVEAARDLDWLLAYDRMIADLYDFDGNLGSCVDYIYNTKYFYDCAFHVNDYGRAYRTYNLYVDVAEALGLEKINGMYSKGTDFDGCMFEVGSDGTPLTGVEYLE